MHGHYRGCDLEPMAGFEPATSSLPRKCSTPELHRQKIWAEDEAQTRDPQLGRLLLYQLSYFRIEKIVVGEDGFEPPKVKTSRFTVCPIWPLWYSPLFIASLCEVCETNSWASCRIRTNDPEITNHVLWPTELKRQFSIFSAVGSALSFPVCGCKVMHFFYSLQIFLRIFLLFILWRTLIASTSTF